MRLIRLRIGISGEVLWTFVLQNTGDFLTSWETRRLSRKIQLRGACLTHLKKNIRMTFFVGWARHSLSKWPSRYGVCCVVGGDADDAGHCLRSSTGRTSCILRSPLIHLLLGISTRVSDISSCNSRRVRSRRITVPLSVAASGPFRGWYAFVTIYLRFEPGATLSRWQKTGEKLVRQEEKWVWDAKQKR
jgi:hypothetical protein